MRSYDLQDLNYSARHLERYPFALWNAQQQAESEFDFDKARLIERHTKIIKRAIKSLYALDKILDKDAE